MEPLSALSVASSAMQIIDFSSKLWAHIREVYQSESGISEQHANLRAEIARLRDLNLGLSQALTAQNLGRDLDSTEKNVVALCEECDSAAGQLADALGKLSITASAEVRPSLAFFFFFLPSFFLQQPKSSLTDSLQEEADDVGHEGDQTSWPITHVARKRKATSHKKWDAVRTTMREV